MKHLDCCRRRRLRKGTTRRPSALIVRSGRWRPFLPSLLGALDRWECRKETPARACMKCYCATAYLHKGDFTYSHLPARVRDELAELVRRVCRPRFRHLSLRLQHSVFVVTNAIRLRRVTPQLFSDGPVCREYQVAVRNSPNSFRI